MVQKIETGGILWLEELPGSGGWYWGTDFTSGDLYEAEELYRGGHRIDRNRVILVSRDGRVEEPVRAAQGQYFGRPCADGRRIILLLADFPAGEVRLLACDDASRSVECVAVIQRGEIEDCYNLMLHQQPLTLTRQTADRFQIVWPQRADFAIDPAESFCFRDGDRLYFSRWFEDPDYREEVVVRRFPDGAVLEQFRGTADRMHDGRLWLLTDSRSPDDRK